MKCSQCERFPALLKVGEHLLCIDCEYKLSESVYNREAADYLQTAARCADINYSVSAMEAMSGLPGFLPKNEIPPPPAKGDVIVSNYNIHNSNVGVINTGILQQINSSIIVAKGIGESRLAEALEQLTNAVKTSQTLSGSDKNEIIEIVSFLAEEATKQVGERRRGLGVRCLKRIREVIGTAADLATIWTATHPILASLYQ